MSKLFRRLGLLLVLGGFAGLLALSAAYLYLAPRLPDIESLKEIHLQVPLRVYTRDGRLIANFGEKRRVPVKLAEVPETMIRAVLASEDERFYEHPGVDWQGLTRAVLYLIVQGKKGPGGSTITMQVARNFFLGREKTYLRKANEILLALKIEHELSKDEILELYLNKIFLGHRAYGVGAAASVYYGMTLDRLTLAQIAMIAGLPKAPSRFNPIANPVRALERRNYVLGQMRELGYLDAALYERATSAPISASLHELPIEVEAPYMAEMIRADMAARYGDASTSAGYRVYATIDSKRQVYANEALRGALIAYDRRHGYRGPELRVDMSQPGLDVDAVLKDVPTVGTLVPALVTVVEERTANVYVREHGAVSLPWEGLSWARSYIDENRRGAKPRQAADIVEPGDIVRVVQTPERWELAQLPAVEGALVALDPTDGAIVALGGGFDFRRSKFNRAIQAQRQPGSNFKPFIYSAALDYGLTAATLINDAPVVFDDPGLEAAWRPENYSGKFFGPTRVRMALTKSRNLVSIRLLREMGVDHALRFIARFGLDATRLPRNLSLALGSGTVTPLEIAAGYAVLANGGFRVEPYFVERIVDADGQTVFEANPLRVCRECEADSQAPPQATPDASLPSQGEALREGTASAASPPVPGQGAASEAPPADGAAAGQASLSFRVAPRVVSARNAWLMGSMLRDVIRYGTGRRARQLGRKDLAGKTGTTNDQRDAWFSGFNPTLVLTTWVGFDQVRPLGRHETGARAALPMWMDFMGKALEGVPNTILEQPEGLVTVRIDPKTGDRVGAEFPGAIFETFRTEHVPRNVRDAPPVVAASTGKAPSEEPDDVTEQLF